jgi:hypothetical protein
MLCFDIETGPLPEEEIRSIVSPFAPPPPPGEFDEAAVKYGNLKDPAKRHAKLEEAREAHAALVAGYDASLAALEAEYWQGIIDKAALSPVTGRILAIGYRATETAPHKAAIDHGDEAEIVAKFWEKYKKCRETKPNQRKMVGCNILDFDLPFLIRRSWILGVDVPSTVIRDDRYFDPVFVDIRAKWLCGQYRNGCESSLDLIGRAFGIGGKPDGMSGKDFARMWLGTPEERSQAEAYLLQDLKVTALAAERMGIV